MKAYKYMLKHCGEYFIFVKYEQSNALNDLWNFLARAINYLKSRTPLMKSFLKYQNHHNFEI